MAELRDSRPVIAHVIYRLATGGLENGLVNLLNRLPAALARHAVVCLTDASDFRHRIERDDVEIHSLGKREGKDLGLLVRTWRLLRTLQPKVVHTRNISALECVLPALVAGVRLRVHGEHGRDLMDLHGENRRYLLLRRLLRPAVSRYVAVSCDLARWLEERVRVPRRKIVQIYNGVDTVKFHPGAEGREPLPRDGFGEAGVTVFGTVGRLDGVKATGDLVRAFASLPRELTGSRPARLVVVGDGALRADLERLIAELGVRDRCWFAGDRNDVPALLRGLDVFVLPSLGEGISNTVLEAMASGLPVVATRVGGNPELVLDGVTGALVPPGEPRLLAAELARYLADAERRRAHGAAGRARAEEAFSIDSMVERYAELYGDLLGARNTSSRQGATI